MDTLFLQVAKSHGQTMLKKARIFSMEKPMSLGITTITVVIQKGQDALTINLPASAIQSLDALDETANPNDQKQAVADAAETIRRCLLTLLQQFASDSPAEAA